MRILVIGAGGVGSAVVPTALRRDFFEHLVVADYDQARATAVAERAADVRISAARIDASDREAITALIREHRISHVLNAVDPRFVMPIFDACLAAGANYMDMAMSLSKPHPERPHELPGVKLGDEQFARAADWEAAGRLALVGMGVEPGLSDVFARYAQDHLFSEIDECGVRDGANLTVEGYDFAPSFSIWTTIEECLNPPVIWERGRDWYTTPPFSEPEVFDFPEGIGPVECVNVEHEEVLLIPRWIETRRATFKYALGGDFIDKLRTIHALGMDRTDRVAVKGVEVAPRDVLAAITPDPISLGDKFRGRAIVGTWVIGMKDGKPRETFAYQMADAEQIWAEHQLQVVGWQTGFNPTIAMELLATNAWSGAGVLGPEAFDPDPYLGLLDLHRIHHAVVEMEPGAHRPT